jgi:molybdopterin synthase catalytic subunit
VSELVRLVDIRDRALSVDEVVAAVTDPRAGGVSVFIGTVREADGGRPVKSLGTNGSALHSRSHDMGVAAAQVTAPAASRA